MNMFESMQSTELNSAATAKNKPVHVVAAVIYDNCDRNRILISKRLQHVHQGGLWEFPGGKVGRAETASQALVRELSEELAICVIKSEPLMQIHHDYRDKQVFLDIWSVTSFTGQARGVEGQECRWVSLHELLSAATDYQFPEANIAILDKLRDQPKNRS